MFSNSQSADNPAVTGSILHNNRLLKSWKSGSQLPCTDQTDSVSRTPLYIQGCVDRPEERSTDQALNVALSSSHAHLKMMETQRDQGRTFPMDAKRHNMELRVNDSVVTEVWCPF